MRDYLNATQELDPTLKLEVRKQRRENLMLAIDSIINQMTFRGEESSSYLDLRYFIPIDEHPGLRPLNPLVINAAKKIFSNIEIMKQLIDHFKGNSSVLEFILEKLVLMSLPNTIGAGSFPLYSFDANAEVGNLEFRGKRIYFIPKPNNFDLDGEGLHCPFAFNFAEYDGFMNLAEIFALQIKLKFTDVKVRDLTLITTKAKTTVKPGNTKEYIRYRLKQLGTQKHKPINIVLISIGQDWKEGNEFKSLRELKEKNGIKFFYADAAVMLKDLGFEESQIEIMRKSVVITHN